MTLFTPRGWDCTPSTYRVGGCARVGLNVSALLLGIPLVWTLGKDCSTSQPNVKLLRAACASKTAAMQARTMASVMTFRRPDAREIAAAVRMATEAEARAWADVDARCE